MPRFRCVSKKSPTEVVEQTLEADSREGALRQLSDLGYMPLKITPLDAASTAAEAAPEQALRPKKISSRHLEHFTRQFASLIRSQIPLLRALMILEEQNSDSGLQFVIKSLRDSIEREGMTLSEGMSKFPEIFPPFYTNLLAAGETGGVMQQIMDELAVKSDRDEALKAKLKGALVYPAFIGLAGIGTVVFLLTFVMPKILKLLSGYGGKLPLPTQMLMVLTHAMTSLWFWPPLLVLLVLGFLLARSFVSQHRSRVDHWVIELPLAGRMLHEMELSRFCRSLGLLLEHGVLILQALDAAIPVVGNRYLKNQLQKVPVTIREGGTLSEGLKDLPLTTPYMLQSLTVGEESGRVGEILLEIANYYEREAGERMQLLATLLEPAVILVVGALVGFIVLAVMLPIFEMSAIAR